VDLIDKTEITPLMKYNTCDATDKH